MKFSQNENFKLLSNAPLICQVLLILIRLFLIWQIYAIPHDILKSCIDMFYFYYSWMNHKKKINLQYCKIFLLLQYTRNVII